MPSEAGANMIRGFWFSNPSGRLQHGDLRIATVGETHTKPHGPGQLNVCAHGFHACVRLVDALEFGKGLHDGSNAPKLWGVDLTGEIKEQATKHAATERTYRWVIESKTVANLMREFVLAAALLDIPHNDQQAPLVAKHIEALRAVVVARRLGPVPPELEAKVHEARSQSGNAALFGATAGLLVGDAATVGVAAAVVSEATIGRKVQLNEVLSRLVAEHLNAF